VLFVSTVAILAVAVLVIAAGAAAIWLVPSWQVDRWRRRGIENEEKLAELGVQSRTSIIQAFGGLALVATLAVTGYQVSETQRATEQAQRLAEQGQVSERFSRAVELLDAGAIDVRTGALFSLMRIGLDSQTNAEPAFLTAAAYVNNRYTKPKTEPGCAGFNRPAADISAALRFVLPRIAPRLLARLPGEATVLGLRGTNLNGIGIDGLTLRRFDLSGIRFHGATLRRADFHATKLVNAEFNKACLDYADFTDAELKGALFDGASLEHATFTREGLAQLALSDRQRGEITVVPG
jgi:hypothetical protein